KSEDDDWIGKTFFHKSLGMRFTADWCGYCPMMATAFEDAKKQLPGNLEVLSLHASGGLHSPVSESLANQFEISGFPTGYVDGRVEIPNYSNISYTTQTIVREVGVTEANYETVTGASWSSAISGNKVSLNLRVYFKASGSYKVSALLVEDNIVGYQNGASDSYVHKDVVRAAFTNALGEKLAAVSGQVHSMDYTIDIPAGCNKANLRIVVYVQKEEPSGAYYVNNAASAAVGKQQPLMIKSDKTGEVEGIVPDDDIPYNN
ncbi:MAG: Omp28-related outer membrane protein, partial [Bacteroidales bacterium]|nr:Omp28-related outer membrane protein [Bacteroidales bacterium]